MSTPVAKPEVREPFWAFGALHEWCVRSRLTAGAYAIMQTRTYPGVSPPPHIHLREDEDFYVLEGEYTFLLGTETVPASAGSFVHVPKGTVHTFTNVGPAPGRQIVILTPGGFEEFFDEFAIPCSDPNASPPLPGEETIRKAAAIADRYHLRLVLDQPGGSPP